MNSIIFESCDQAVQVRLEGETVWLTQTQMAELFGTTTDNISLHLKNVYASKELEEIATTEDFSAVRQEGARTVKRQLKHYNLDAIISVGYRVNSTDATRFRQWATNVLRQHLVDGYSLSQRRLKERGIEFKQALDLLSQTLANQKLVSSEGEVILGVIADYARSWSLLQGYDEQSLTGQTGSFLFLWYLQLNQHLLSRPVDQLINDNTLVALALLVAESKPDQRELMVKLVQHFVLLKEDG